MNKSKITKETFRKIPSLKFLYEINPYGIIRNIKSKKILKQYQDKDGYFKVSFANKNIKSTKFIHRLVAEVFIPNPNNYPVINHKDENRQNNYYKNLEWCSVKYNNCYGTRLKAVQMNNPKRKDVYAVDLDMKFSCSKEAAEYISKKYNKTNINTISRNIRNGALNNKFRYGTKWKYL